MTPEEICDLLKREFGEALTGAVLDAGRPYMVVDAGRWVEVATFLRDDSRMRCNMLQSITSLDLLEDNLLACVYDFFAMPVAADGDCPKLLHHVAIRVVTDRKNPHLPSVAHIWPAADWHEREAYDMMGIVFDGHPNLERILCPDDWEGYPLRKDYEFPLEYHEIPATTEFGLTNPRH
jgi:NADH-quinone oxidoreductase subunit C